MTQAKGQSLEEMARETCGCQDCAKWGHEEKCKAVDIAALARSYANQRLREAAEAVRATPRGYNGNERAARAVLSMIEGEQ